VSIWEPALATAGGVVAATRHAFVREQAAAYADLCARIGERQRASLRYAAVGGDNTEVGATDAAHQTDALTAALAQHRANDMRRGATMVGPHRDDLQLQLGGRDLRSYGSAGQQRSAAIALRLLELTLLHRAIGHPPLLLLDDPFAELDLGRAGRVLGLLEDAGAAQVLLAVPRLEDIPAAYTRLARHTMRDGQLI
jgi:DNA replication and repair protein RecF